MWRLSNPVILWFHDYVAKKRQSKVNQTFWELWRFGLTYWKYWSLHLHDFSQWFISPPHWQYNQWPCSMSVSLSVHNKQKLQHLHAVVYFLSTNAGKLGSPPQVWDLWGLKQATWEHREESVAKFCTMQL